MEIEIFAKFTIEEKAIICEALKWVHVTEENRPTAFMLLSKEYNPYPLLLKADVLLVKILSLVPDVKETVDKARDVLINAIREMEAMKSVQDPYMPPNILEDIPTT